MAVGVGLAAGAGVAAAASGANPRPGATGVGEPLILLTDVADPPTGAVQVGEADASSVTTTTSPTLPAGGAGATSTPESTAEMPAATAAEAAAATAVEAPPADGTPSAGIYDDEADARPWGKYLAFGLVIALGLVALGYAGWLLLRTESYEVPDLVGVEESIALNEIAGNGWVIETDRERSDDVPEVDHVVRTVPAAGVMLDEGETFTLVVSDGPELRTLPELSGMTVADATAELEALLLVPLVGEAEFSEEVPLDSVIRWQVQDDASLVAGAQVLPGAVIEITPSLGPEPRPAPDLAGATVEEATATLEGLQLVLDRGEDVFSNTVETGRIVEQVPAPGTPVERGGSVTVQVSKGPDLVPIPDLTGLSYPQAETALQEAGFVVDSLLGTTEGVFVSISVDGTEVAAGDLFVRGTGVDLIFL
jgi:serine/threonine-protein kinase